MIGNGLEKNEWKVQPDTTVQVVDPHGIKKPENSSDSNNCNGIMISLGIIFTVGLLIAISAIVLVPLQVPPFYGRPLTLQDLNNETLRAAPLGAQWLSDHEFAYLSEGDDLLLMNLQSNATSRLISRFTLQQIQAKEFSVSLNRLYVLLTHDIEQGRLFKRTAKYSIYDLSKNHYYPLKLTKSQLQHPRYQHVQWVKEYTNKTKKGRPAAESRDGVNEGGSELVIVFENNIQYMTGPRGRSVQITQDGARNEIFNGIPNIMNEEIMKKPSCMWPNPSGHLLAYVSFDDRKVHQIPVMEYGIQGQPSVHSLRYPTVSSILPEATVWVVEVTPELNISKWRIVSPLNISREEHYVIAVGWVHDSKIWVSEMSRDQSTSHLMTCEGQSWNCTSMYVNHLQGGISPTVESVVWLGDWAAFPWPIRIAQGWWYNHVAVVGAKGKKHPTLTLDGCHVKKVLATDHSEKVIYFLGSKLSQGTETQQLYSVSARANSLACVSCTTGCAKVKAKLNQGLTHAVITCIGTHLPTMHLIDLSNLNVSMPLHTQPSLRREIDKIALPISIYKEISLSASVHASVTLSLPPGWKQEDDTLLYPLVIQLFGIENYDDTDVEHCIGWKDLLASGHYVAHARVKFWGSDSSHHDDSIQTKAAQMANVIRLLLDSHRFLDSSRLSIWGWGSGASIALKVSEINFLNLKCIMAVNPVMDWKQYGSYWSERLLGSIYSEGAVRRYEESNLVRALDSLNDTQIMLMQSTSDPISHHSFGVAQHLISKGIYFQHIVYPDSTVALRKERNHVLKSFQTFISHHQCLKSF